MPLTGTISNEFIRPFIQGDYDTWKNNIDTIEQGLSQREDITRHTNALGNHNNVSSYHNNNHGNYGNHSNYDYHNNYNGHSNYVPHSNYSATHSNNHGNYSYTRSVADWHENGQAHVNNTGTHVDIPGLYTYTYTDSSGVTHHVPTHGNYFQGSGGYIAHANQIHYKTENVHSNSGHSNSIPHSNSGGYHNNNHGDSYPHSNHNNHSNSGHSNNVPHTNNTPHINSGFDHNNFVPSKPYIYEVEANQKRLFGVVDLKMYSYDKNNEGEGSQFDYSKTVQYKVEIRRVKKLDGTASASPWVKLREFTTSETYSFNSLDPLMTGNTDPVASNGYYELRVTAQNPANTQLGVTKTYIGDSKVVEVKIEQNNAPSITISNSNEFLNFTFGVSGALSSTGTMIDYGSLLFKEAPADKTSGVFVSLNISDQDINNYLKGTARIINSSGTALTSAKEIIWDTGSNIVKSDGTPHKAYVYFPKEELLNGTQLTGAKIEVTLKDYIDDECTVATNTTVIQSKVSKTDTRDLLVNIDNVVPTLTLTPNTTAIINSVTVAVSASDTSGIKQIKLPNGNVVNATSTSYTITKNGTYSFEVVDKVGNTTTKSISISNIDNTPPVVTITPSTTAPINGNVILTVNTTDDISGINQIKKPDNTIVNTPTTTYTVTTNGTYTFTVTDKAGNITTASIEVNNIDKTAPNFTLTQNPTAWTNGSVTISADIIEAGSGVRQIKLPNGTIVTGNDIDYVVGANGTYSFEVTDNVGLVTTKGITISNIDKIAPTINATPSTTAWTGGNVTVSVSVSDTGGSGIDRIELPNGTTVTTTTASFIATENGEYTFSVYDRAGNRTDKVLTIANIDKTKPTVNVTESNSEWTSQDVALTINAVDMESGMKNIKLPNGTLITGSTANYTVTTNGSYIFEATDNVGNKNIYTFVVDNIDKTPPVLTLTKSPGWSNGTTKIIVNASDAISGIDKIKVPNGNWILGNITEYTVGEIGVYYFTARDKVGNETTSYIVIDNIDKTKPTVNVTNNQNWNNSSGVPITITGSDQ